MYYRYEVRESATAPWKGVCTVMNPSEKRKIARFLAVPKWYAAHPGVPTTCWLTEYGYEKYHERFEEILEDWISWGKAEKTNIRLRKQEKIGEILCKGKVQCIAEQ